MNKFIKFIFSKKIFQKPPKKKFLVLDSLNYDIFKTCLDLNHTHFLETRYKSINLFVLFSIFLRRKFSFNSYIEQYIDFVDPDYIISFIDNNIFYYHLKEIFPEKKIIIIQNGMRTEHFFEKLSKFSNLKVNYLLTFSDFYSEKYSKSIKGKCISIGSFKNNLYEKKSEKKNNVISYISSGPSSKNNMVIYEKINIKNNQYFLPEEKLLPLLSNYCDEKKLTLQIILRSKNKKKINYEKNFYKKILGSKKHIFVETKEKDKVYRLSDESLLTICIYSAFGLEALSRGNRTVILNLRDQVANIKSLKLFWSSIKIEDKGLFWTNDINHKEIFMVLDNTISCSDEIWKNSVSAFMPHLINYDKNNKKFLSLLI